MLQQFLPHAQQLFQRVYTAVSTPPTHAGTKIQRNAKGDWVKWFDLAADQAVCDYLTHEFPYPVTLLSEEGEPRQFGHGEPEFTMILDPVDGSENFLRGLSPAGLAIALLPASEPIRPETLSFSFIGNLFTQDAWWAGKGEGTYYNGAPLQPRITTDFEEILLSFDFNHYVPSRHLMEFIAKFRGLRSLGAATLSLATVSAGICAIHIDPRGTLTPENFVAPALLIIEAGGVITDMEGKPLTPITTLTDKFSILATVNEPLHEKVLAVLSDLKNQP